MPEFVGALDQGTTSTRFIVFDHAGTPVARHQLEHRQHYPRPGWVEHDPLEILDRAREAIAGALARRRAPRQRPRRRRDHEPARDHRRVGARDRDADPSGDRLAGHADGRLVADLAADGGPDRFRATTGLPLATYFSGPKIRWILDHVDGRAGARRGRRARCSGRSTRGSSGT